MKCLVFAVSLLSLYEVSGNAADYFQENARGTIVKVLDGKNGVNCPERITDLMCPRDDITFWLYTKNRQDNPHQLNPSDENTIRNAPFVKNQPVKILIHGYTMNKDTAINEVLRPAYFKNYDYNIISVDWSAICPEHCYEPAAHSVPTVGTCVKQFMQKMFEVRNDLGEIHILGHSLGAHVTAWASLELDLKRVTQFDPALPLFSDDDKDLFRRPEGTYVDVWHSNSGVKGRVRESGTVDIFFNDKMDQPGCSCDTSCSHLRAVQYFAETVSDKKPLKAFPCKGFDEYSKGECQMPTMDALADFGEHFTSTATGAFLAFTNPTSPFIINGEDYTKDDKFHSFKDLHNEVCPASDVQKELSEWLNI